MALQYFLYNNNYGGTIVDRSNTPFSPTPPLYQMRINFFMPETQPTYLYANSGGTGGTIIINSQANINNYLNATQLPPTSSGNVTYGQYSASTVQTNQNVAAVSATTNTLKTTAITGATNLGTGNAIYTSITGNKIQLKSISGGTGISISNTGTRINICSTSSSNAVTGATNLGSGNGIIYTSVSGNKINLKSLSGGTNVTLTCNGNYIAINAPSAAGASWTGNTANGVGTYASASKICSNPNMTFNGSALSVTGNINASTYVCSPIITGSTKLCSPIICGTSCVISPITCGTSCVVTPILLASSYVCSPIITGSTKVCSPIVCGTSCTSGAISCGTTCVQSPVVCGTNCVISTVTIGTTCVCGPVVLATSYVCSPTITGSTKVCSPIICGTSCVISPVVLGSTCVCSPTICSSTCLCSTGTARFTGNVVAASCLNVSGATRIVGITQCEIAYGNPTTGALTGTTNLVFDGNYLCVPFVKTTGSGSYFYTDSTSIITNTTTTCKVYLSGAPWTFCAGTYRVDINANVGNGSSNGCTLARITCDGTSIGGSDYLLRSQTANFNFAVALTRDLVFTAGCHCLVIYFWAGSNTACISYGAIRAARIC